MSLTAALLAAALLPPVIADPRAGPSTWQVADPGAAVDSAAPGYLVSLPERVDDAWLRATVALGSRGAALVLVVSAPPAPELLAYFDGVLVEPAPAVTDFAELRARLGGLPLLVTAADAAGAVAALGAGAAAVLVAALPAAWEAEFAGLLPEPLPARAASGALATAMRGRDLATVVGLPGGFAGGDVTMPGSWYGEVGLVDGPARLPVRRAGDDLVVTVPPLPGGGVLIAARPAEAIEQLGTVEVRGERPPTAAEVLARHQRQAARQELAAGTWRAEQRLLVRVWIPEVARGFEVALEGPVFRDGTLGTDWEIARAWVDGVEWRVEDLPDLPLIEPERPRVPPFALRLEPGWRYELRGAAERDGRPCWELAFASREEGEASRAGTAWLDRETFGLVALEERAEGLPGEVRSTRAVTSYRRLDVGEVPAWLPVTVVADDLVAAFGGSATVRRELTLAGLEVAPAGFAAERAAAWSGVNRMWRERPQGTVKLVPDGQGGRVEGGGEERAQWFLLGGLFWDPGLDYPLPVIGVQGQDFRFRGRDEQLRVLIGGVINDAAWTVRRGQTELTLRGFVQLLAFENSYFEAGEEVEGEALKTMRQRLGVGVARPFGPVRLGLEADAVRLDFSRADDTAADFVVPNDTFEGVLRLEATAPIGATTLSASVEGGRRSDWQPWGIAGAEPLHEEWRRWRLAVVHEVTPFPLAKLHVDAQLLGGADLDRFSAYTPARFTGLRLRGIASDLLVAERVAAVSGSLALPLSRRVRGEVGIGAAWARDRESGYDAEPLAGIGVGVSVRGPWRTLLKAEVAYPVVTPGERGPVVEVSLLRPLTVGR
jgi:hypothetical protein